MLNCRRKDQKKRYPLTLSQEFNKEGIIESYFEKSEGKSWYNSSKIIRNIEYKIEKTMIISNLISRTIRDIRYMGRLVFFDDLNDVCSERRVLFISGQINVYYEYPSQEFDIL